MSDNQTALSKLSEKLYELSAQSAPINSETEVFYDLKISGDDFDELIDWISEMYGTDFSAMRSKYVPGEAELFPLLLRLFGKRPYQSLTVQDLLDAIEAKVWREAE